MTKSSGKEQRAVAKNKEQWQRTKSSGKEQRAVAVAKSKEQWHRAVVQPSFAVLCYYFLFFCKNLMASICPDEASLIGMPHIRRIVGTYFFSLVFVYAVSSWRFFVLCSLFFVLCSLFFVINTTLKSKSSSIKR